MPRPKLLSPSLLSADFSDLKNQIALVERAGADWLHLDVMDGHFVPNITFGPFIVKAIRKATSLYLDAHLMVTAPGDFIDAFADAGVSGITVHQESSVHLDRLVEQIRTRGLRAGVSVNPATPLEHLEWILPKVDMVLIMSVNPGFGGQSFIPYCLDKIRKLRKTIVERNLDVDIEVDGGIGPANVTEVIAAGANVIVAGSSIFGAKDISAACKEMKAKMKMGDG